MRSTMTRNTSRWRLVWFAFILILSGCAGTRVVTDFTPGTDYLRYRSFAWVDPEHPEHETRPIWDSDLLAQRVAENVSLIMKTKGFQEVPAEEADMLVSYRVSSRQKISSSNFGVGYFASPFWVQQGTDVYSYEEGTLAIDIFDAKTHNLIWRGWTSTTVDNKALPPETINDMVTKILAQFPPHAQKS